MIVASWGAVSVCGPVRSVNEDGIVAQVPVFVVVDGMGGHAAGDVASRLAVDEFEQAGQRDGVTVAEMRATVRRANRAIVDAVATEPARRGMGATIAGLAVVSAAGLEHWMVFNVGDCRVYRVTAAGIERLTTDHSEVEELLLAGQLTEEEARSYPRRNVVTRSLGTDPPPVVDSRVFPPEAGDRFIVCSDGLTDELDDAAIGRLAAAHPDPDELTAELVRAAVDAGGHDNVSVIVVEGLLDTPAGVDGTTVSRPAGVAS